MRILRIILLAGLLAPPIMAQTAADRLDRWALGQQTALNGVRQVTMLERANHMYEGAAGPRRMGIDTRYTLMRGPDAPGREVVALTVDGKPVERPDPERRRRHENPVLESMRRSVDLLLQPERLLLLMEPPEGIDTVDTGGQQLLSIRTRASDEGPGVVRAEWLLHPEDGRLVQVRVFLENPEGGAFDASTRYERIQGIDLPVRRRVEGSFPWRRRMRTFTILVDVRADIEEHRIDRG